jgi:hypothetical protein
VDSKSSLILIIGDIMSNPSSIYNSGLQYVCDRDPQTQEPTVQEFIIANFNSPNKVEWINTVSRDSFLLTNVDINGNLLWSKYNLTSI